VAGEIISQFDEMGLVEALLALTLLRIECNLESFGDSPDRFLFTTTYRLFCMDAILRQIGELLVNSIPTIISV